MADFPTLLATARAAASAAVAAWTADKEARFPGTNPDHHDLCGFAWVEIPDGRSPFARFAKANGANKHWKKGVYFWSDFHGMSIGGNEVWARAFAGVLKDAGIAAHAASRLD